MLNTPELRKKRKLLVYSDMYMLEEKKFNYFQFMVLIFFIIVFTAIVVLISGCAQASDTIEGYTLPQWVEAIHKAEGNDNYGILSIKCEKGEGCRKICANTVRNNYKRWLKTEQTDTFIHFLANRFAPLQASNDPDNLNVNWERNVSFFLQHQKTNIKVK